MRRFLIAKLFQVAQLEDLAILGGERLHGLQGLLCEFSRKRRSSRSGLGVAELSQKIERRAVQPMSCLQGLLTIKAAPRGHAVAAAHVDHAILGHLPQPEMKGQLRIAQVFWQSLVGLDQHILNDIAGIDALLEPPVQPQFDDPPQGWSVFAQQLVQRSAFTRSGPLEQFSRALEIWPHDRQYTLPVLNTPPILLEAIGGQHLATQGQGIAAR